MKMPFGKWRGYDLTEIPLSGGREGREVPCVELSFMRFGLIIFNGYGATRICAAGC